MSDRAEIDLDKLNKLLKLKPTLLDTAAFFDCSERAIERRIKEEYGRTFREHRDRQVSHTRHALIQKAVSEGLSGNNTMLIFALKNMCNWSDKKHLEIEGEIKVSSIADLIENHEIEREVLEASGELQLEGQVDEESSDDSGVED